MVRWRKKDFKELFGHTKTLSQHGVDENSGGALIRR